MTHELDPTHQAIAEAARAKVIALISQTIVTAQVSVEHPGMGGDAA